MERERPANFLEMTSGDHSWREVGLRLKWTEPGIPSEVRLNIGEPLRMRVAVEVNKDVCNSNDEVSVHCWTNLKFKDNAKGMWRDIKLFENPLCSSEDSSGVTTKIFNGSLSPAKDEFFRMTFNIRWRQWLIWANQFQVDTMIYVAENHGSQLMINAPIHFSCSSQPEATRPVVVPAPGAIASVPIDSDLHLYGGPGDITMPSARTYSVASTDGRKSMTAVKSTTKSMTGTKSGIQSQGVSMTAVKSQIQSGAPSAVAVKSGIQSGISTPSAVAVKSGIQSGATSATAVKSAVHSEAVSMTAVKSSTQSETHTPADAEAEAEAEAELDEVVDEVEAPEEVVAPAEAEAEEAAEDEAAAEEGDEAEEEEKKEDLEMLVML